jgi:hypothetical protein
MDSSNTNAEILELRKRKEIEFKQCMKSLFDLRLEDVLICDPASNFSLESF